MIDTQLLRSVLKPVVADLRLRRQSPRKATASRTLEVETERSHRGPTTSTSRAQEGQLCVVRQDGSEGGEGREAGEEGEEEGPGICAGEIWNDPCACCGSLRLVLVVEAPNASRSSAAIAGDDREGNSPAAEDDCDEA